MKKIIFLTAIATMMIFAVSCKQKSDSLKIKTIVIEDFVNHSVTTDDDLRLNYNVSFSYPSEYGNKAVLEILQRKFISYSLGEKYSLLTPEEAVNAFIADRKAEYLEEIKDRRLEVSGCQIECRNDILFVSDTLLQLNVFSSEQWSGSRRFEETSSTRLNIKTGAEENLANKSAETIETELSLDPLTADEGVVINGVKWATRNVATPGTFAATPEDAGMFYKWNNKKAWATIGDEVSDWDDSISYDDTWAKSNDPSPAGWHVPTDAEFITLLFDDDKVSNEWTTQNGVNGRKFTDKANGNSIFLPALGARSGEDGTLNLVDMQGSYWTSTTSCPDCSYGAYICEYNVGMNDGENRSSAYNIRSVAD